MKRKFILNKITASAVTCTMFVTTCVSALISAYVPAYGATTSSAVSEREKKNAEFSAKASTEGMVLLENNNNTLPIASKGKIALFGGGAINTIKGGTGSGDVNQRYKVSVQDAFKDAGYDITSSEWLKNYQEKYDKGYKEWYGKNATNPYILMMPPYQLSDYKLTDDDITAAKGTDTAIYVISRSSGEGADRTETKGDYYLTDEENTNIKKMAESFKNSIVLLNVGGIIDTKFVKEIPELDSVLLMSQGGMEGGTAAVKVLNGTVNPSGKLTDTWAENYSDYPSSKTFSSNDGNSLQEDYEDGIFVGYRYFDSFNKKPAYEFGYGLSYTTFDMQVVSVQANEKQVTVKVNVKNTGNYKGKEVAQVYFSAPSEKIDKPYQELAGYGKTDLLAPGESQTLTISYDTSEMSSYNEDAAAYIMEKGNYVVRVGDSSRNTHVGAVLSLDSTVITEQLSNQMKIDKNIDTLSSKGNISYSYAEEENEMANAPKIKLSSQGLNLTLGDNSSKYDNEAVTTYIANSTDQSQTTTSSDVNANYAETKKNVDVKKDTTLYDVYNKNITMEQFVAGLSNEKLANIVEGIGMGGSTAPIVGAQSNSVKGAAGETTGNYYETDGIPNIVLSDGPAGIRITQSYEDNSKTNYQYATAWPIGSLLAQTWNPDLVEQVGEAIGQEMNEFGVTLWLAPGMNIHRNPLCGRNFEYYSEDPFLTGTMGAAATKGVQSNPGIGVTIKHFATNNQENNRSGENNTVTERALREIYLKGFEMTVKGSQPMAIMSSYNKINGKYTGADYDLLTDIVRGEWKFGGLVMTDWYSGADPSQSMHAGNDLIMPGGSQDSILSGIEEYAPIFNEDGYVPTKNVLYQDETGFHYKTIEQWNDFISSADGTVTVFTKVKSGTAINTKIKDMVVAGNASVTFDTSDTEAVESDLNHVMAETSPYNRIVTYKGSYANNNTIFVGDLEKSAMNVLNIIMQSTQFAKMNADKGVKAVSYTEKYDNFKNYLTISKEDVVASGSSKTTDVKNKWSKNVDGTWSFVNSNGEKAIGWIKDDSTWYHLNSSGVMETGWIKDNNGLWYYLNNDGAMKTGWLKDTDGKWYYLNTSGYMAVDTTIDGYKINSTGAWLY